MAIKAPYLDAQLRVATASISPAALNAMLARYAKDVLAETIASGEGSPKYTRAVNGRLDAPEEQVKAPGPIVYVFSYLEEITTYALEFARARSPKASGRYRNSWFALVNDRVWNGRSDIPADAQVIVTNDRPYSRKIEVGAMKMRVPPHVVEDMRQAIQKRYPKVVTVSKQFTELAGAYRLRRNGGRRGRRRGDPITYPALVIDPVL